MYSDKKRRAPNACREAAGYQVIVGPPQRAPSGVLSATLFIGGQHGVRSSHVLDACKC